MKGFHLMNNNVINALVWNEGLHEQRSETVRAVYPDGIHAVIADALNKDPGIRAGTATISQPEHGLSEAVLAKTDVLLWWGHMAHKDVQDAVVERVHNRVLEGMGLIVLHSGHVSKIFRKLMGTSGSLKWREVGEREVLWVTSPGHPIVEGIDDHFVLEHEEMYGEHFDVPEPLETIMISSFAGGEVFRSACTWHRGAGKVFYFRPGHETYPTYRQAEVQRILTNAVHWAAPKGAMKIDCPKKEMGWWQGGEKK
jgi:trehalose utilization protein